MLNQFKEGSNFEQFQVQWLRKHFKETSYAEGIPTSTMYKFYSEYWKQIKNQPVSRKKFGQHLTNAFPRMRRKLLHPEYEILPIDFASRVQINLFLMSFSGGAQSTYTGISIEETSKLL